MMTKISDTELIDGKENSAEKTCFIFIVGNWRARMESLVSIIKIIGDSCSISSADFAHIWTNLAERQADVLVVDRWSPSDNIVDMVKSVRQQYPEMRILVLDCFALRNRLFNLYPADIVLESDVPYDKIVDAVSELLSGKPTG
jgi:DNA-binding NarL/FixJ family response regulator